MGDKVDEPESECALREYVGRCLDSALVAEFRQQMPDMCLLKCDIDMFDSEVYCENGVRFLVDANDVIIDVRMG